MWTWGTSVGGNLWRTTGDIRDNYERMAEIGFNQIGMAKYAGPGHWNDPDMLEIGNGGMNYDEEKTHMSLWAILGAPLIAGNDLSHMSPETLSILTNREVIAVDQDRLGRQDTRMHAKGATEIWTKPMTDGALAAGLFNRDTITHVMTLKLKAIGFGPRTKLRDLWAHTDVTPANGQYMVNVPPHGG